MDDTEIEMNLCRKLLDMGVRRISDEHLADLAALVSEEQSARVTAKEAGEKAGESAAAPALGVQAAGPVDGEQPPAEDKEAAPELPHCGACLAPGDPTRGHVAGTIQHPDTV